MKSAQVESAVTEHTHPLNPQSKVRGRRLTPGEVTKKGDLYDCSDGRWRPLQNSFVGSKVPTQNNCIVFVRPETASQPA